MLRFEMDNKDYYTSYEEKCKKVGIVEDTEFYDKQFAEFDKKYPEFVAEGPDNPSEADDEYWYGQSVIVLKWEEKSPKTLEEAFELIKTVFFFPPYKVWLDGKLIDLMPEENSAIAF